jgi:hypothetical protein
MAEFDFEAHLSRLYAEPPALRDAERFATQVGARLDRGWAIRRVLIGAAGVVAGLIAAAQIVSARFAADVQSVSKTGMDNLNHEMSQGMDHLSQIVTTPASAETLWLAAALAAVALAFGMTRAMEEF